jgi:cellular nucleic acid-binding protein
MYVYVLRCKGDKYYVGKSSSVLSRLVDHATDFGSAWTKRYPPTDIVQVVPNADEFDEDKYVKKYMRDYGIDNVRGGSYVQMTLPPVQLQALERELRSASDTCLICGEAGHFAKDCLGTSAKSASEDFHGSQRSDRSTDSTSRDEKCFRCGRNTHRVADCFATTSIDGTSLPPKGQLPQKSTTVPAPSPPKKAEVASCDKCYRCGRGGHLASDCYATKHANGGFIVDAPPPPKHPAVQKPHVATVEEGTCYRCGREGHYAADCYVRAHMDGTFLGHGNGHGQGSKESGGAKQSRRPQHAQSQFRPYNKR